MNRLNTIRNIREANQPPRLKSGDKITIEMDDQDGDFSAGDYTVVGMGNPGTYILSGMGHSKLRVTLGALKDAGYSLREDKLNLKQIIREEVRRAIREAYDSVDLIPLDVKGKRIEFRGNNSGDLFDAVKGMKNPQFFVNGKFYNIYDVTDLKQDSYFRYAYLMDEDGEEHEIKISDIEFVEEG